MQINTNRSWDEVISCLQDTHTLSSRDICNILKVNRPWVNKYIIPFIDTIYLNGFTSPGVKKTNWLQIASIQLNDRPFNDSMWINNSDFYKFLSRCTTIITRQTRRIPVELLISDIEAYKKEYTKHIASINTLKDDVKYGGPSFLLKLQKEIAAQKNCFKEFLSPEGKNLLLNGSTNILRRGETEAIEVTTPPSMETIISYWKAPHDIKNYGDTDESVYREFFKNGYTKIELEFEDLSGQKSKKVYYLPDLQPISAKFIEEYITVSEAAYQNFIKEKPQNN